MAYPSNSDEQRDITAAEIRAFIERIETLESEKRDLASDIKEVYAEIKGRGFSTKVLRSMIADRRKDKAELDEFNSIKELYTTALDGLLS